MRAFAATREFASAFACVTNVLFDGRTLARGNERAELRLRFGGIADNELLRRGDEFLNERLVNAPFDEHPTARATILARVREDAHRRSLSGALPIGVGKDNVRRFAAEFERDAFQVA